MTNIVNLLLIMPLNSKTMLLSNTLWTRALFGLLTFLSEGGGGVLMEPEQALSAEISALMIHSRSSKLGLKIADSGHSACNRKR